MSIRHKAIRNLYPSVTIIDDGTGAFDAQGSAVLLNEANIAVEVARLEQVAEVDAINRRRQTAYQLEADPLFFKAQRGEATMEEWQAKVAEIKARFPKE